MPLTHEIAARIFAAPAFAGTPPEVSVRPEDSARRDEIAQVFGQGSLELTIFRWQLALAGAFGDAAGWIADSLTGQAATDPRFEFAVGFFPIPDDLASEPLIDAARSKTFWVFGIAVFDHDRRGGEPIRRVLDLGRFASGFEGIPVLHVPVVEALDTVPDLDAGTGAAWARLGAASGLILTAAHVVNWWPAGYAVPFEDGTVGATVLSSPRPVDAALVAATAPEPSGTRRIDVERSVGAFIDAFEFRGKISKRVTGRVTAHTMQVLGMTASAYHPQRVMLDTPGQAGDSGALVQSLATGRALSLYTGRHNAGGVTLTHSQAMFQAVDQFPGLDLFN